MTPLLYVWDFSLQWFHSSTFPHCKHGEDSCSCSKVSIKWDVLSWEYFPSSWKGLETALSWAKCVFAVKLGSCVHLVLDFFIWDGLIYKRKCWGHTGCQATSLTRCNDWGFASKLQLREKITDHGSNPSLMHLYCLQWVTPGWIWPHVPREIKQDPFCSIINWKREKEGEKKKSFLLIHIKNNHFLLYNGAEKSSPTRHQSTISSACHRGKK